MKRLLAGFILLSIISCTDSTSTTKDADIDSSALLQEIAAVYDQQVPTEEYFDEYLPPTDTTFFEQGAFLYWQNEPDSSWLTLETTQGGKQIMNYNLFGYWDQLGTRFIKEYENYLFFIHEWISGCCTTPDYILIDKATGNELTRIPSQLAAHSSPEEDFFLFFSDSTLTEMHYLDLKTEADYRFDMKQYRLEESAQSFGAINLNDFINFPQFKGDTVIVEFDYFKTMTAEEPSVDSLVFVRN